MKIKKNTIIRWGIEFLIIAIIDCLIDFGDTRSGIVIEFIIAFVILLCVDKLIKRIQRHD